MPTDTSGRLCAALASLFAVLLMLHDASADPPEEAAPRHGGELAIAIGSPVRMLNPALTPILAVSMPGAQLFASLFRLDAAFSPQPYLAEHWQLADDGLSLTVELRRGARFHDGAPITSRDVAFSILAVRDQHSLRGMLAAVSEVETPDAYTAVIRLSHPHAALFTALSAPLTPILPAHVYGVAARPLESLDAAPKQVPVPPLAGHPANSAPVVGSGPFRFVRWTDDGDLILERFEDYFLPGLPLLDRLVFRGYASHDQIAFGIAAGEVQLVCFFVNGAVIDAAEQSAEMEPVVGGFGGVSAFLFGLTFNLHRPPLDDPRVRTAIAAALNRDYLYNTLLGGKLDVASGPFPPGHPLARPVTADVEDTARANRLLDEAGWPRGEDGYRFSVQYLNGVDVSDIIAFGDYLRAELGRKLGIAVDVTNTAGMTDWFRRMGRGDFDIGLDIRLLWGDPIMGLHRTYHSSGICPSCPFSNYAGYSNPAVDALLDAAGRESDQVMRAALYWRFQEIVAEERPYLWLGAAPTRGYKYRDLVFPVDSPWAAAQPYDHVYWKQAGD